MKDLAPAFDANKTNVDELANNVASLSQQIRPLAIAVWDAEIESRRTAVIRQLQKLGAPHRANLAGLTGARIDADLADVTKEWKADYDRLGTALAAAAGDGAEIDRLEGEYPVLAAIRLMKVGPDKVAEHCAKLFQPGVRIATIRTEITQDYPLVVRAVTGKKESLRKIDELTSVMEKQLKLSKAHSELFAFAAKSNLDMQKAFSAIISDEGLQGQVLGLIKDDRWKTTASDAFSTLTTLLDTQAAAKTAETK